MPIYYSYDEKANLVHSHLMCDCSSNELVENMRHIVNSQHIHDGFVELVDLERLDVLDVDSDALVQLKEVFSACKNKGCKRIVFFQPHPNRQELLMARKLRLLMSQASPENDNILVFTRNRDRLLKLIES